jgi:hypothetical protein
MGRCIEHDGVEWKLVPSRMWEEEKFRASKRILHYYWSNDNLMFKGLWL